MPCGQRILSAPRLPVPPHPHEREQIAFAAAGFNALVASRDPRRASLALDGLCGVLSFPADQAGAGLSDRAARRVERRGPAS